MKHLTLNTGHVNEVLPEDADIFSYGVVKNVIEAGGGPIHKNLPGYTCQMGHGPEYPIVTFSFLHTDPHAIPTERILTMNFVFDGENAAVWRDVIMPFCEGVKFFRPVQTLVSGPVLATAVLFCDKEEAMWLGSAEPIFAQVILDMYFK